MVIHSKNKQNKPKLLIHKMLKRHTDSVLFLMVILFLQRLILAIKSNQVNSIDLESLRSLSLREASQLELQMLWFLKVERLTMPGFNGVSGMTRLESQWEETLVLETLPNLSISQFKSHLFRAFWTPFHCPHPWWSSVLLQQLHFNEIWIYYYLW